MIAVNDTAVEITDHDLAVDTAPMKIDTTHNILVDRCFGVIGDSMHLFLCLV